MTVTLFITLLAIFAVVSSLVTQAAKKAFDGLKCKIGCNLIALITSCVIGVGGTAAYYGIFGMAWDVPNIICMCLMGITCAVASMVGYDKVTQAVKQIVSNKPTE